MSSPTITTTATTPVSASRLRASDCHLPDLLAILAQGTEASHYPHATDVISGVVIYDAAPIRAAIATDEGRAAVESELVHAWSDGPGIIVIRGAFASASIDRVSAAFDAIIKREKEIGGAKGDHFGIPGANDRIWNAHEKLALLDPEAFVDYYDNPFVALCSHAWLGPGYQVTASPNVVRPGGKGQTVHRDYHLGFMDERQAADYPRHAHALSPALTLQGAIAHVDMPVESGPTLYLPHSQKYELGYLAYWLPEFQDYFVEHHVQLPLTKGDLVFFNPALFHAAGSNVSATIQREANLLQVNSAFGRAMDAVDRAALVNAIYPALLKRAAAGHDVADVIAASAEGYAFPTNLDRDEPGGAAAMAPPSQADVVREAIAQRWSPDELARALELHSWKRATR